MTEAKTPAPARRRRQPVDLVDVEIAKHNTLYVDGVACLAGQVLRVDLYEAAKMVNAGTATPVGDESPPGLEEACAAAKDAEHEARAEALTVTVKENRKTLRQGISRAPDGDLVITRTLWNLMAGWADDTNGRTWPRFAKLLDLTEAEVRRLQRFQEESDLPDPSGAYGPSSDKVIEKLKVIIRG